MHGRLLGEGPCGPHEPGVPVIDARVLGKRIARMQIERHVKLRELGPEPIVARVVEIYRCVGVFRLTESVHQRATKAQLLHCPLDLTRGFVRVLHGERGEPLKALGVFGNLRGDVVVRAARDIDRSLGVNDGLHRGRIQRQQRHLDPRLVHLLEAIAVDVGDAVFELRPVARRHEDGGVFERVGERIVFFERDFPMHPERSSIFKLPSH